MNQVVRHICVTSPQGIHARPAAQIVRALEKFSAQVWIEKPPGSKVSARSILELLMLAATQGTKLVIHADGEDAEMAVHVLCRLIEESPR
jgi:phosphocarrier protein HPr